VGRQGQRSGAAGVHHQRQYSDNFLETSSNGRWLQSAGLQHLHSSNPSIPPLQVLSHLYVLLFVDLMLGFGSQVFVSVQFLLLN
jgi:hypothetical protein